MYAVVSSGGKQYRVEPGTTLTMERVAAGAGEPFTFDRVLLVGDGDAVTVGTPVVAGASVSATVLGEELGPKLVIFKFKQKVKYRRRTGHRQRLVRVRIDAINADGSAPKAPARKRAAKAEAGAEEDAPKTPAKPRARRKPAASAKAAPAKAQSAKAGTAKADTAKAEDAGVEPAKASASEEKPKTRRTTRSRSAAKKPAASDDDQAKEQ